MHKTLYCIRSTAKACDYIFQKFYKPIMYASILLAIGSYIYFSYKNAAAWDGWVIGDWLINFSGGFVRRGLFGEFILYVSQISGLKLNRLVFLIQIVTFLIFCVALLKLLQNKKVTFWYFFWFTYPAFIAFYIFDKAAVGRKEILLLTLYACWILYLKSKPPQSIVQKLFLASLSILATLTHELFAFFAFYFLLAAYVSFKDKHQALRISFVIPLASIFTLLIIFLASGDLNRPEICDRLINLGAGEEVCRGILRWQETTVFHALGNFSKGFSVKTLAGLILIPCVIIGPAVLFLLSIQFENFRYYILALSSLILLSFPIFFVAIDWGRWVHIHSSLLILSFLPILEDSNKSSPNNPRRILTPSVSPIKICFGIIILLTSSLWMLRHCCTYAFFEPRFPIF